MATPYITESQWFQSLFFWNGLWDYRPSCLPSQQEGFNPCFSGMAFGTGCFGPWNSGCIKFQSLFFWNGLWDVDLGYGREGRQEVSILVFLEWPLGRQSFRPPRNKNNRFQSLFFWNGLWDDDL